MAITLRALADVLRGVQLLTNPSIEHLIRIIDEERTREDENPYSLRGIVSFLTDINEYVKGAANLKSELAVLVRKARIGKASRKLDFEGGTKMARKKKAREEEEEDLEEEEEEEDESDDEDMPEEFDDEDEEDEEEEEEEEDDEDEEDEEEEEEPVVKKKAAPKRKPAKKEKPKKAAPKKAKAKANADRNAPVKAEDRIPVMVEALKAKGDATINELYHRLNRTKGGRDMFPTRRSVKRVLAQHEGEAFVRTSTTLWAAGSAKKKVKKATKKEAPKKGKKTKK